MRKVIAIAVVLVVGIAILVERGVSNEPAINADAAAVASSGELAVLGPVGLVSHPYNTVVTGSCSEMGANTEFTVIFDAVSIGASGTITTAVINGPLPHTLNESGGTVTVTGKVNGVLDVCGTGYFFGLTVTGLINGVDGYIVIIEI